MTKDLIVAYTKPNANYPGYINASRDGDRVILTMRGDPTSCVQIFEAKTVTLSLSTDEWAAVVAAINGG